jgi:hypothetical protein
MTENADRMDVEKAPAKRGPLSELSNAPKVQSKEIDRILKALGDGQKQLAQQLEKQITALKTEITTNILNLDTKLTSKLDAVTEQVAATNLEVQGLKTVQAKQTQQLGSLTAVQQLQQLEINCSKRELFDNGYKKQTLHLSPIKLDGREPKLVVIDTLKEAILRKKPAANGEEVVRFLQENVGNLYVTAPERFTNGQKKIKFHVASPAIANIIWEAKSQLPKGIFLDVQLTPMEHSNRAALWGNGEFKKLKEFAKSKGNNGSWLLDEFVLRWEAGGNRVKAFYHKAYPMGLLADGKPAPSYPGFAEAVAAGMA